MCSYEIMAGHTWVTIAHAEKEPAAHLALGQHEQAATAVGLLRERYPHNMVQGVACRLILADVHSAAGRLAQARDELQTAMREGTKFRVYLYSLLAANRMARLDSLGGAAGVDGKPSAAAAVRLTAEIGAIIAAMGTAEPEALAPVFAGVPVEPAAALAAHFAR